MNIEVPTKKVVFPSTTTTITTREANSENPTEQILVVIRYLRTEEEAETVDVVMNAIREAQTNLDTNY